MCHDWWQWRMYEEREASRKLWEEFEKTRPVSDPEPMDEEVEVTLEERDPEPAAER